MNRTTTTWMMAAGVLLVACEFEAGPVDTSPPAIASVNAPQAATVGGPFTYDASKGGAAFTDPSGRAGGDAALSD